MLKKWSIDFLVYCAHMYVGMHLYMYINNADI